MTYDCHITRRKIMEENLLKTIWKRRSMIWLFAVNDLKLRYRNSFLGFLWSFLEPLLLLGVMYIVFTTLFHNSIENYPLYLLSGLILWNMFSRGTSMASNSLLSRAGLIQKMYFRRETLVISSVLTSFFMMVFEFGAFAVFMAIFGVIPPLLVVFFPLVVVLIFLLTLGISFFLSSLNVYYRDTEKIWAVIIQAGMFLTPIFYKLSLFPESLRSVLELNPMVGIMEISRAFLINAQMPDVQTMLTTLAITGIVFICGYIIFRKLDYGLVEEL
jgi:lipopolysaccharide transport system permease protein